MLDFPVMPQMGTIANSSNVTYQKRRSGLSVINNSIILVCLAWSCVGLASVTFFNFPV